MTVRRKIARVGGSLGVLIPRDIADAMGVEAGSPVRLTLVGRQMVVEPTSDDLDEGTFRRAFAAVLRRNSKTFAHLAAFDRGEWAPERRQPRSRATRVKR
ncbi:MAG TPA: AbrB/MazE/SpoVT family DNA-binding domain-containing protein [Polyangiaceae bacterium]|jgi:antitoxin component of MazEF toxin-antitoxin module